MKTFIFAILVVLSVNAQAAVINVSTDKAVYNPGDTIFADISFDVSALQGGSSAQPLIGAFETMLSFDSSVISFNAGSILFGAQLGAPVLTLVDSASTPGAVLVNQAADFFADLFTLQSGLTSFSLFSMQFTAIDVVSVASLGLSGTLTDTGIPAATYTGVTTQNASFAIQAAAVPAPSSALLTMLACFGVALLRVKSLR